jgi:hypothetical protein
MLDFLLLSSSKSEGARQSAVQDFSLIVPKSGGGIRTTQR